MKNIILISISLMILTGFIISCSDDKEQNSHDPGRPVILESFYPDSGGIATRVIISGSNFGQDTSKIKVYFNQKRAAVVTAQNHQLYVLTPKLPGEICELSVEVDGKKESFDQTFKYKEQFAVTTLAGYPGSRAFEEGSLSTASYGKVSHIAVDTSMNVFVTEARLFETGVFDHHPVMSMLNEKANQVSFLFQEAQPNNHLTVPTVHSKTQVVYVPVGVGYEFYELDPSNMWYGKKRQILHPTAEQQSMGMKDFATLTGDYKHSFAFSRVDGMIYTRSYKGQLIKIDPNTRVGQLVTITTPDIPQSDSYLAFDPIDDNLLYLSITGNHAIYTYNLATKEIKLFAGSRNKGGWQDGPKELAEFKNQRQITIGNDGNIYIADTGNQCIRMIDKDTGIVTTPIGLPGEKGYVDGTPEVAKFNSPYGIATDKYNDIYIADQENRCIRKLTLQ